MKSEDVLFITLDSCRFDTFSVLSRLGVLPNMSSIGPLHKANSPSYFTFGSHSSFWMGFTPGVIGSVEPFLNPKVAKLFRMSFAGHPGIRAHEGFTLFGSNIVEGFSNLGYLTLGTGAVDWFDTSTPTGSVLTRSFDHFYFSGNTWSLRDQLSWIDQSLSADSSTRNKFVFLNVGETHVPYWHDGASWDRWPSPCVPFGSEHCSSTESMHRQRACLEWIDSQLAPLLERFRDGTILICSDHGDCWGEDGLWEHGISHYCTLTVPLILRVRGIPVSSNPGKFRSKLKRFSQMFTSLLP